MKRAMKTIITRLGVIASLVIMALIAPATTGAQAPPASLDVVAMGDSFASGVGAGDYAPGTIGNCYRSANSYGEQIASDLNNIGKLASFVNVTCSGATTDTVRQTQLSALNGATDLILLTVGGNDAGFAPYAQACFTPDAPDCSGAPTQAVISQLPTVKNNVQELLQDIGQAAPQARIAMVGYGELLERKATNPVVDPICEQFTTQEHNAAWGVEGLLDGTLLLSAHKAKAEGTQVTYSSPYAVPFVPRQTFKEHSICDSGTSWYHGFDVLAPGGDGPVAILHPTIEWQSAIANVVHNKLGLPQ